MPRPSTLIAPTLIAAAILAALPACAPVRGERVSRDAHAFSVERAVRLPARRPTSQPIGLDIEFPAAIVTVDRRPGVDEISIDYQVHAAARDLLAEVSLTAEWTESNTLRIRPNGPTSPGYRRWYVSRLDVSVPEADRLVIETASGNVIVSGLGPDHAEGFLDARPHRITTASGDVMLLDVDGPVTVRVSSGNISIQRGSGDAVLSTSSGEVEVRARDGEINARTSSGSVTLDEVSKPFTAETASGNIDITVLREFATSVRTDTYSGEVRNARSGPDHGFAASSATTTSGDITIREQH